MTVVDDQADNLEDLGGGGLLLAPQQILPHARQADATILRFRGRDHLPVVRRSAEARRKRKLGAFKRVVEIINAIKYT